MSNSYKRIQPTQRRGRPLVLLVTTIVALLLASLPVTAPAVAELQHNYVVDAMSYRQQNGHWDIVNLPEEFRLNTVHASMLPSGKVLLVAGSGNTRKNFDAYNDQGQISVLKTVVYDPDKGSIKQISTPSDLFCSGHALLQSGSLLIAGGTSGYELLASDVKKPAGAMTIHNENPSESIRILKKGTQFTGPSGKVYASTKDVTIEPATKMDMGQGHVMITHSTAKVFVEAIQADKSYINTQSSKYSIEGMTGSDSHDIYGQGGPMTLDKQDYRGDDKSYEFDPFKEEYVRTGDLNESRWYASLPVLTSGDVLAVSGLDNTGKIATSTESFNPETRQWSWGQNRAFPTYPALFRTMNPDVLFYSGSNAGYGPADQGRTPGFWNVKTNDFKSVSGLRNQDILETSGSVALPPAKGSNDGSQSQRIMLAGGGGVGESNLSTSRTDIIDLASPNPAYAPGPTLPAALRYLNLTVTPWDEVFASGGSVDYRAKENSYSYKSFSINPTNNKITPLADEMVGRSYHSGSILLKDGRILVFGNDPLFSDKANTTSGTFEQRLEIYTPPQLYQGARPTLQGTDMQEVARDQVLSYSSDNAATITTARLIPPSSTTHVTNTEQRSVAAVVTTSTEGKVSIQLPSDENLLPNGWYMLFVTNAKGTPSIAKMIHIVR